MRRTLTGLIVASILVVLCFTAEAQQAKKVPRIGFLTGESLLSAATRVDGFKNGLHQLGYIEGQNILIDYRYADGKLERLPDLAKELVQLRIDLILSVGATATTAAKRATQAIPIVMTNTSDPVTLGLVASLAKPGGNITGLSNLAPDLGGKRLELLKEIVPRLSRVAVLGDPSSPVYDPQINEVDVAARGLGLQLDVLEIRDRKELENAFPEIIPQRPDALIALLQPSITTLRGRIGELTTKGRLPAIGPHVEFTEAGTLISYGPNTIDLFRRAATYVDKILKGAKPAELPVEQPTKFELVINLKTAKQIGLTIPPHVLARADKVIK
jgi:putative ABC transport system substrate-binding protein